VVAEYPVEMKYSIGLYIGEVMDNIHTHHLGIIRGAIEPTERFRNFKRKDGCSLNEVASPFPDNRSHII
jgi:hypothetical protein